MVEPANYQPLSGDSPQNSVINLQEYFLQGSVTDENAEKVRQRLQGLCDNVPPAQFADVERVYFMRNINSTMPIIVKASKSLVKPNLPWQLKYMGATEVGEHNKPSMIRSSVTLAVSQDPTQFLNDLGFLLQFEATLKGYFFKKGRLKITIAKLAPTAGCDATKLAAASGSHLMEVSTLAPPRDETAGDEVKSFCQLLRPIAVLDKVDHRRLQQMV